MGQIFAEGRERRGGVLHALLRADGRAEDVVEVRCALRRGDGVAASDVRLVDEALVAALDQREAVPEEVLGRDGQGRTRSVRPTVVTGAVSVDRAGELAVDVVVVGVGPLALGDGEDLVEIAVAVGPVALLDEATRRVVGRAHYDTSKRHLRMSQSNRTPL